MSLTISARSDQSSTVTTRQFPRSARAAVPDRFFAQLEIIPIGSGQWRVRDSRIPSDDARSLLGFIERIDGRFDVLAICAPRRRVSFAELSDALAELASHAPQDWAEPLDNARQHSHLTSVQQG